MANGLALLSKDDDFRDRVERTGSPPKLVFVRLGNVSTLAIAAAVLERKAAISAFLAASEFDIFTIWPDSA